MDERREKRLLFNCDSKYIKGHTCGEKKLFYMDCEDKEENEQGPSQDDEIEETPLEYITPTISFYALDGIRTPQTIKIKGYIKKGNIVH